MNFTEKNVSGLPVFELEGKVYSSAECLPLVERIKQLIDEDQIQILLDFRGITFINSTGFGGMLSCIKKVKEKGGDLHFVALPKKTAYYFRITKLDTILGIYKDTKEALEYIKKQETTAANDK